MNNGEKWGTKGSICIDEMTGLYDKQTTQALIETYINKSQINANHALIVMDVDNLKKINEVMGHRFGDTVIKAIASSVKEAFRKTDIIGRFGGDEFLILMKNTSKALAENKASKLCKKIHEWAETLNNHGTVSCSIGISYYGEDGTDYESLFSKADIAMYQSKVNGKNMFTSYISNDLTSILIDNKDEEKKNTVNTYEPMISFTYDNIKNITEDIETQKGNILIVEDEDISRAVLKGVLQDDYNIAEAMNGKAAIEYIRGNSDILSAVLVNAAMIDMNGMQLLSIVRNEYGITNVPIVFISSDSFDNIDKLGYEIGVSDIIHKPFDPYLVKRRLQNIVELYRHRNNLQEMIDQQTMKIKRQASLLESNQEMLMSALGTLIECRSMGTGKHVSRVRMYTKVLLEELIVRFPEYNLSETDINIIATSSTMHDIGKIAIPDKILLKKSSLTANEYEIMKTHTIKGCEIIESVISKDARVYYEYCRDIALYHHERWDGRGYPEGLSGDDIPISAQVSAIADVYDALTVDRIYKKAISHDKAVKMINNGECGAFSPKIFECFNMVLPQYERIAIEYADTEEVWDM